MLISRFTQPPHDDARRAGIAKTLTKPNISSQYGFGVKKVYRHLMDGDFLLVNRQPTLHKPSKYFYCILKKYTRSID